MALNLLDKIKPKEEFPKNKGKVASKANISKEVSNILTREETRRGQLFQQDVDKVQNRKERLLQALQTAETLLENGEVEEGSDIDDIVNTLKDIIEEQDPEEFWSGSDDVKISTSGMSEIVNVVNSTELAVVFGGPRWTLHASTGNAGNIAFKGAQGVAKEQDPEEFGSGSDDVKISTSVVFGGPRWTLHASTSNAGNISIKGARGVAIDNDGYIAIADIKPECSYGAIGISWSDVKKYLMFDQTGWLTDELEIQNISQFDEAARDVAMLSDDRVAVACPDEQIDVYDIEDGEHIRMIPPPNPSSSLWALAVDQNRALFIGNGATNEISRHERKKRPFTIKTSLKPWFIAANSHIRKILVSNWRECRVDVMSYEGQSLFSITSRGPRGPLRPNGVCFHGHDTIYIVHKENKRGAGEVHRYNAADGSHVGVAVTDLENPHGICVGYGDFRNYMVVADWKDVKIFKQKL